MEPGSEEAKVHGITFVKIRAAARISDITPTSKSQAPNITA
jgi:hypothetical protein